MIMSVEIIAASVTFLVSLIAIYFLRGPADIDYHKKVADELEASLTISFIIGVVGSFIVSVWMRMPAIIVAVLAGLCLGIGLHPLCILYSSRTIRKKKEYSHLQRQVIDLAKKYAGVLSVLHLIIELEIGLKLAYKILEEFVKQRLAKRFSHPKLVVFYDFPIVGSHMLEIEREIVEKLKENPEGLTFQQIFLDMKGLSVEALRYSLNKLESDSSVVHDYMQDKYMLRSFYNVKQYHELVKTRKNIAKRKPDMEVL
jgi:hypothetical protein